MDLGAFADESRVPLADKTLLTDRVHRIAYVIAAVCGVALGAGMYPRSWRYSARCNLRPVLRELRSGSDSSGGCGCHLLPRLVGMPRALVLLSTTTSSESPRRSELTYSITLIQTSNSRTRHTSSPPARWTGSRRGAHDQAHELPEQPH